MAPKDKKDKTCEEKAPDPRVPIVQATASCFLMKRPLSALGEGSFGTQIGWTIDTIVRSGCETARNPFLKL